VRWVHLWSGATFDSVDGGESDPHAGRWLEAGVVAAPLGSPPVFFREGSKDGLRFVDTLRERGLMERWQWAGGTAQI